MSDAWSRRKAAAEAEAAAEARAEAARGEARAAAEIEALPEAEQLERLGLPTPESVASGEDVAAFLRRTVPAALRNRALRALWRSNPVLANLDGLNDYDADYRGDGLGGGVLRTTYAVGKGLAAHMERLAERAAPEPSDENAQVSGSQGLDQIALAQPSPVMEASREEAVPEEGAAPVMPPAPSRRMRFTFEEDPPG